MEHINELIHTQKPSKHNPQKPTSPPQSESKPRSEIKPTPPPPQCDFCADSQYIKYDVDLQHPLFGQLFPCTKCNQQAQVARGLYEGELKLHFGDIETVGRPGAEKMLQAAKTFITNQCKGFLTIHGGFGNGKTTLMQALANECASLGIASHYITMTEVMVYAKEAFQNQQVGDSDYGRITKLAKTPVLLIDEVDKANLKEYGREVQNYLFNFRYRNAGALGTVVAWNGDFNAVELPAVLSRLSEFTVVENYDADMRPQLGVKI